MIENCVFPNLGRGNWTSSVEGVIAGREWAETPWDSVSIDTLSRNHPDLTDELTGKSEKVFLSDPMLGATVQQASSTDLAHHADSSLSM